jgi:nitroreductase
MAGTPETFHCRQRPWQNRNLRLAEEITNIKNMEFKEVLEKRRSIRKFKSTEIPDEKIREILQLAQLAPSAGNVQAYKIKIIKNDGDKKKLPEATFSSQGSRQDWIAGAPVALIICADINESEKKFGERGRNLYAIQDATIFTSYVQLVIASLGLASGWLGNFKEEDLRSLLNLPENLKIIAVIPFGYPDSEPEPRKRKKLDEILLN